VLHSRLAETNSYQRSADGPAPSICRRVNAMVL
jgi:hypothetical protein